MRSFLALALIAASTTLVAAQLPACASTCLASSLSAAPSCASTDLNCLCTSTPFVSAFQACLTRGCSTAEAAAGAQYGVTACASVGVTLAAPSAAGSAAVPSASRASSAAVVPAASSAAAVPASSAPTATGTAAPAATSTKAAGSVGGAQASFGLVAAGVVLAGFVL